jgi:hypothetical protein
VGDVAGRRVVHRREADTWAEVGAGEFLQELWGASFGDAGGAVDDEVLIQAGGVALAGLDRERDPAVVADVAQLAVVGKVAGHYLVAVEADPHDGHLGAAVWVQSHQVRQGRGLEHCPGAIR